MFIITVNMPSRCIEKCIILEKGFIKCMKRTNNDFKECAHIDNLIAGCFKDCIKLASSSSSASSSAAPSSSSLPS